MAASLVVDASVAAKVFFEEPGSEQARAAVMRAERLIAPDWILLEVASIAVKKVRRREISKDQAAAVMADLPDLIDQLYPATDLIDGGVAMAYHAMTSTYDGVYAALAQQQDITLITADKRLAAALRGHSQTPTVVLIDAA
jgi:predicted nucleic acid-binding protein